MVLNFVHYKIYSQCKLVIFFHISLMSVRHWNLTLHLISHAQTICTAMGLDAASSVFGISPSILIRFSSGLLRWARPNVLSISYYWSNPLFRFTTPPWSCCHVFVTLLNCLCDD